MSDKRICCDNACVETFVHAMKIETIHGERVPTGKDTRREVFEYTGTFYNTTQQRSALGYVSPEAFEARVVRKNRAQMSWLRSDSR